MELDVMTLAWMYLLFMGCTVLETYLLMSHRWAKPGKELNRFWFWFHLMCVICLGQATHLFARALRRAMEVSEIYTALLVGVMVVGMAVATWLGDRSLRRRRAMYAELLKEAQDQGVEVS